MPPTPWPRHARPNAVGLVLERANRARRARRFEPELEAIVEDLFGAARHLAVYGTLAPGRSNHHHVASLGGRWLDVHVTGELAAEGQGASLEYPALRWVADGPRVPARLLVSDGLPAAWARLDAFEGDGYRRILVPVHAGDVLLAVANLYEGAL